MNANLYIYCYRITKLVMFYSHYWCNSKQNNAETSIQQNPCVVHVESDRLKAGRSYENYTNKVKSNTFTK